ncbi:hypothetical protein PGAG_00390 [Phaeocystis globosa virus 12T]|uniref:Uncharacterized protein n=1 Tax=Phaeocystis globosa virus PgV-16T TaxID=3071227 RepID=A0AC59EXX6_9VIRU|nr:hypothetical protein PGCG_00434 [Phaeocystis globosa virus]AET73279.1 hypothetical protein PGAG_00390 [Phaeocystis globosa virus 12T]AGM15738.1 hypothetical protein PGCG_00434 [Phaeocystis globosa virus PgV-16T]UYE94468.1 hypothetical protein PGV14T_00434 [Phaeocystis globosa virus]
MAYIKHPKNPLFAIVMLLHNKYIFFLKLCFFYNFKSKIFLGFWTKINVQYVNLVTRMKL